HVDVGLHFALQPQQCLLKRRQPDRAPRADHVGHEIDAQRSHGNVLERECAGCHGAGRSSSPSSILAASQETTPTCATDSSPPCASATPRAEGFPLLEKIHAGYPNECARRARTPRRTTTAMAGARRRPPTVEIGRAHV